MHLHCTDRSEFWKYLPKALQLQSGGAEVVNIHALSTAQLGTSSLSALPADLGEAAVVAFLGWHRWVRLGPIFPLMLWQAVSSRERIGMLPDWGVVQMSVGKIPPRGPPVRKEAQQTPSGLTKPHLTHENHVNILETWLFCHQIMPEG